MSAPNLNIRQMEVIRAVLQAGSMTKAADELNISQPAISRMIRYAEQRSGLALFIRKGTLLIPTPEALELHKEIERIFVNVDRAQRLAIALRQGWGRITRLAAIPSLSPVFVAAAAGELVRQHPRAKLILKTQDSSPVEEGVRAGDYDFGLVLGTRQPHDFVSVPIAEACMVCLLAADHPLTRLAAIRPADLAGTSLVSFGRMSPLGMQAERLFQGSGVERQVAVQTGNSQLAVQLVAAGCGPAIADPFFLGLGRTGEVVMRPIVPRTVIRPQVIHRKDRVLSALEQALVSALVSQGRRWQATFERLLEPEPAPADEAVC